MATPPQNTSPLLISFLTLRKAIGFLGISIPAVMIIGTFTIGGCTHVQNSISHYYYTVMGDVFVGFLISTGIFLITYKGYDLRDNIVSFLAGIFIICVALKGGRGAAALNSTTTSEKCNYSHKPLLSHLPPAAHSSRLSAAIVIEVGGGEL